MPLLNWINKSKRKYLAKNWLKGTVGNIKADFEKSLNHKKFLPLPLLIRRWIRPWEEMVFPNGNNKVSFVQPSMTTDLGGISGQGLVSMEGYNCQRQVVLSPWLVQEITLYRETSVHLLPSSQAVLRAFCKVFRILPIIRSLNNLTHF